MVASGVTSAAPANSLPTTVHHTVVSTTGTHTRERPPAGRVAEEARLDRAIAAAATGSGAALFIEGPVGSGKSLLLETAECVARREGMTTIAIRCTRLARERRHGPVLEALMMGDAMVGSLDAEARHDDLVAAFRRLAEMAPVLVTVDDLQYADRDTQDLVFALRRLTERLPIALVATARDWPSATARLVEPARNHIALRPLHDDALVQLAVAAIGCPPGPRLTELLATTGGNPFLCVRLIEALESEGRLEHGEVADPALPLGFCRVVQRFLGELSEGARALVRAAAVLGTSVRIDRVAAVLDVPLPALIDPVDELLRHGALQDRGADELVFAQPIVAEAICRSINAAERLELHMRAARELERQDDRRSLELYGLVCDPAADGDRTRLTVGHIRTLVRSGRFRDAEAAAGSLGSAAGSDDAGGLRADLTEIRYHRARWNELIADVEPWLEDCPGSVECDRLSADLAAAHAGLGHADRAAELAREVLERQGAAGDPIARTIAYQVLAGASAGSAPADEIVQLAHRAVREAERMGTWQAFRRHPHTAYALALADAGRPDRRAGDPGRGPVAGRPVDDRLGRQHLLRGSGDHHGSPRPLGRGRPAHRAGTGARRAERRGRGRRRPALDPHGAVGRTGGPRHRVGVARCSPPPVGGPTGPFGPGTVPELGRPARGPRRSGRGPVPARRRVRGPIRFALDQRSPGADPGAPADRRR